MYNQYEIQIIMHNAHNYTCMTVCTLDWNVVAKGNKKDKQQ